MKHTVLKVAIAAALLSAASAASAATATTTFNVTATVKSNCSVTANALNFGAYDPGTGTALAQSSTMNVNCTKTTPFTVFLNAGLAANGGSFAGRVMKETGGNTLTYNLYTDSALTTVWGDTTSGTGKMSGTGAGMGTAVPFTVYGNIPYQPNAVPTATTYTDTITVTVNF